jgi:purine catabolism regulator
VHSSDLADPTPFLADDLLLLTTGTQFVGARRRRIGR